MAPLVAVLGCLGSGPVATPSPEPSTPPCYRPNGTSALLLGSFQAIVSGTDSISAKERGYHALPQGPPSKVPVVTDNATCATLLRAYRKMGPFPSGEVRQVYAFQVGQVYVVVDTKTLVGEWSLALTFDSKISKVLARVFQ